MAEHSLIVELRLISYRFTADDAINFIQKLNSLNRFQFAVKVRSECDRLLHQLDNEWEHKDEDDLVITLCRREKSVK